MGGASYNNASEFFCNHLSQEIQPRSVPTRGLPPRLLRISASSHGCASQDRSTFDKGLYSACRTVGYLLLSLVRMEGLAWIEAGLHGARSETPVHNSVRRSVSSSVIASATAPSNVCPGLFAAQGSGCLTEGIERSSIPASGFWEVPTWTGTRIVQSHCRALCQRIPLRQLGDTTETRTACQYQHCVSDSHGAFFAFSLICADVSTDAHPGCLMRLSTRI